MSEAERKRRLEYKQKRKKLIFIQIIAIAVIAAVLVGSFATYRHLGKTYYIDYTEKAEALYDVTLKQNEFYDKSDMEDEGSYVAALIDSITAKFKYDLCMSENNVDYEYSYAVDAQLIITDDKYATPVFAPVFEIKPKATYTQSSAESLCIRENVVIDYHEYNDMAESFIRTYGLSDMSSELVVRMSIDVLGSCEELAENAQNSSVIELSIPLTGKTVSMKTSTTVPMGQSRVLACVTGVNQNIFKIVTIVSAVLECLLICALLVFTYSTRNDDINYTIKVNKLVSNYRSYIQKINNVFDTRGYQVLSLSTFKELLCIRDTIQSPILMSENSDKTATKFFIPTNTKLLYMFEIRVEDYDDIYGTERSNENISSEEELQVDTEVLIIDESFAKEELIKAMDTPDVELDKIDFVDEIDEAYEGTEEAPGFEVVGVVWPERPHGNKVYRYDPNGETLEDGDIVLVPTRDAAKNRDVVRKAAVAHGNHEIDPATLKHPLKKIIGVVRRKAEKLLESDAKKDEK